jgi:hypothetical protein
MVAVGRADLTFEVELLEAFAEEYPHAIRIRPTRLLDWGARELSGA